jgi:hypothetical protein
MSSEGESGSHVQLARKTSAAKRLRTYFEHLNSFSNNKPLHQQWARVFGVSSIDASLAQLVATEVARKLSLVGRQVDLVERRLRNEHPTLTPNTTSNQAHRLRLILANCLSSLQAPAGNLRNELTQDLLKTLEFWDELLPCDEVDLADSRLNEVADLLDQAEQLARNSSNADLAEALVSIIQLLRRAINDGAVGGEDEFHRNVRAAYTEAIKNEALIKQNSDDVAVSALKKVWDRFSEVCAPVILADSFLTAASRLKEIGGMAMKLLGGG